MTTWSPLGGIAGPQPNAVANLRSTTAETSSLAALYNEWAADDWPDPISDDFGTQDGVADDQAPCGVHRRDNDSRPQTSAQNPVASLAAWGSPAIGGVIGSVGASDRSISTESVSTESVSTQSGSTQSGSTQSGSTKSGSIRGVSVMGESSEMTSRRPASTRGASGKDGSSKGTSIVRASSRGAQRKDASYRASESPPVRTLGMEDNVSGSKLVSKSKATSSDAAQVSTFGAEKALRLFQIGLTFYSCHRDIRVIKYQKLPRNNTPSYRF